VFFDFFALFIGDFTRLNEFVFFGSSGKCGKRLGVKGKFIECDGFFGKGRKEIETFSEHFWILDFGFLGSNEYF